MKTCAVLSGVVHCCEVLCSSSSVVHCCEVLCSALPAVLCSVQSSTTSGFVVGPHKGTAQVWLNLETRLVRPR